MSTPLFSLISRKTRGPMRHLGTHWALLVVLSVAMAAIFLSLRISAALLLGPMVAAIALAAMNTRVRVPALPFAFAQGIVGCMIAHNIPLSLFTEMGHRWPIFATGVMSVLLASCVLGYLLTRWQVLPGSVALWGSFPGAATAMVLMADSFGADVRLVAFMQYLRVVTVAVCASVVSRLWSTQGSGSSAMPAHPAWIGTIAWTAFAETLLVAAVGVALARRFRVPAGSLLVPMLIGVVLEDSGVIQLDLPYALLALSYALVAWSIGLRFTREIVAAAWSALPRVLGAIFALVALCGGFSAVLVDIAHVDPLTAYLAMSPGGADSVAIIAASSHVDMPFVMAMQVARFLFILFFGPAIARMVARTLRHVI